MEFRRLLPDPGTVDVHELLGTLRDLAADAADDRPYTIANFIASADGRATIGGRSGPLGDDGDRAMFHGLREQVDAVITGTVTLQTERYGRVLRKSERRERREALGLSPEPLAAVFTRSGHVPVEIPLFAVPDARIVVFTPKPADIASCAAQVETVILEPAELTLTTAMRRLRNDYSIRTLLCEGGPTLFGALLHERLIDELFLTIAPKLAGGGRGPTITSGPELADPRGLRVKWLLERSGLMYLRYRVA